MNKSSTKKFSALLLSFFVLFNTTACDSSSGTSTSLAPSASATKETATASPESSKDSTTDSNTDSNENPDKIEAGLGDLVLYYNNKWTYDDSKSENASLAFTRGDTLIGVVCSKETTYQLPQDMMKKSLDMVKEQYEDFKMIEEAKKIEVNGDTWYECSYVTGTGKDATYNVQRCYGKNYYGYTVTYTGLENDFDDFKSNAMTIMNSCVMSVPDNTEGEEAAKKELAGELDAGKNGYLELNEDGTYYWYSSSDKAMDNVHYGTYACDNQISAINMDKGHNGFYLALFPEKYFVNGEETDMGTYQINFAISKTTDNGADYQGINLANYNIYDFTRIK